MTLNMGANVQLAVPALIAGNIFVKDKVAKKLVLTEHAHEPNEIVREKLNSYLRTTYISCETSGNQCACALHATFGSSMYGEELLFMNARQTAGENTKQIIVPTEIRHKVVRGNVLELVH